MPEKYEERPPTVDAIQFVGGQASAIEINNWLSSFSAEVTYDSLRDKLIIQTAGQTLNVSPTDWAFMDRALVIKSLPDADFEFKYKPGDDEPGSDV